jgi:hypothetical protein
MPDSWYQIVVGSTPLTQGDILNSVPVFAWDKNAIYVPGPDLTDKATAARVLKVVDLVVMTQACDLEQNKVGEVVLCPLTPLSGYCEQWCAAKVARGQKPTDNSFAGDFKHLRDGIIWHQAVLDRSMHAELPREHQIVSFDEVYSLPRGFLESLLTHQDQPRLRLIAPYREHLSQSFARYFMRVGLPTAVAAPPPIVQPGAPAHTQPAE